MKIVRTTFITVAFFFLSVISYSQSGAIPPFKYGDYTKNWKLGETQFYNYNELVKLKGRTLLVVVDDQKSPEFSKAMREGFTKYWTLTKVNFINPSEVKEYINDEQYALFCFSIVDIFTGPFGGGGNGDYHQIIDADSLAPLTNNKKEVIREGSADRYFFEFMLCGHFPLLHAHNLDNILICNYQEIYLGKTEFCNENNFLNHPVKYYQAIAIPYVIPYIIRFQKDMEPYISNTGIPDKNYTTRETRYTITMNNKTYKHEIPVYFIFKTNSLNEIKNKNIYIDSSLVNDKVMRVLSTALNVDQSMITPVSRLTINEVFKKQNGNVLVLDYNHVEPAVIVVDYTLGLYNTSGEKLGETGINGFWRLKYESNYNLNFVSESTK